MDVAARAPWDNVPAHDQLFVLITGANSGIGLAIGQRLIDEFLSTRPLTAHLILLPTTRSTTKSLDTIRSLRAYALRAASQPKNQSRAAGAGQSVRDTVARIHVLSLQLDLCDLRGVYAFAHTLCAAPVSNPEGLAGEYLRDIRIPRLDSVVFNAAYGGWSGVNWPGAICSFFTQGLVQMVTWPTFKNALPTRILNEQPGYDYPAKPRLGEVFVACVFGHYVLAHQLLPLLSRRSPADTPPGRIIWSSSIEAHATCFSTSDPQCFDRPAPYESAKRLTDILSLTSSLPSVRPHAATFLRADGDNPAVVLPPSLYLTHPGIVASTLFPVPWFLMWAYEFALVISRFLGSPWHTTDSYSGAKSVAWVVLQEQTALDELHGQRVKWGSSSNRRCEVGVKKTEVDGWGWEGKVASAVEEGETEVGVFRKAIGRKKGVVDVTADDLVHFEELGVESWKEMERLRHVWEDILQVGKQ